MATQKKHGLQQNNGENGRKQSQVVVVMVAFPAQGHMNQLLHLSRLISSYSNIPIHYVNTTTYIQKAKSRLHGWDSLSTANFHFHECLVPYFLPPPPTPRGSVKIPALFQPSIEATAYLREPVAKLLHALSPTAQRLVVIHDFLASSTVQDVVSIPNAEAYTFHGVSAFHVFSDVWELLGKPSLNFEDETILEYLPPLESAFPPEVLQHIKRQVPHVKFNSGNIYDGCRLLEGKYIDLIATKDMVPGLKQWALGPLNPVSVTDDKNSEERHKCLKWLDTQAADSVIYVCFGTTVSLSDRQVEELAIGLEKSEQKFIWVLRDADREVLYQEEEGSAELPKGYEERVKGQGMILRDWAPQLEILAHPSTGGFLSHCGWNSCMESITMGVPIAGWPMHSDQPRNILLITKGLKTGIAVRDWALGHKLVTSLTVEKTVRKLMASKEGEEIRKRAAELGGDVRRSMAKGGATHMELDSFIAHITREISTC